MAQAYVTTARQRGRDQPAVLNQRIIHRCNGIGAVTYSDQLACPDQAGDSVVRVALKLERTRQPYLIARGHRASTAQREG
jgi:hypothetical protein